MACFDGVRFVSRIPQGMVSEKKCAKSLLLMDRLADDGRSAPKFGSGFRQALNSPVTKRDDILIYALRIGERPACRTGVRVIWLGPVTGDVVLSKLSKLLNQEDALSAPCLKHFRNYCGAIKLARCGFPWEKTTKRPIAPRISSGRSTGWEQLCATFFTESRM
jgi:hypothetical protein